MSRSKENIPLNLPPRRNGDVTPASEKDKTRSNEFFTDSILDVTRNSSRIPAPSPSKQSLAKVRRARTSKIIRSSQSSLKRPSTSESLNSQLQEEGSQPATPPRSNKYISKTRADSLPSPARTSNEPLIASPYASISSPPPQDLTDAYRQIEDAENLAQTEREDSSDDGDVSQIGQTRPYYLHQRSYSESPVAAPKAYSGISPASTPTRSSAGLHKMTRFGARSEIMSDASGLSFLQNLTNQDLAQALTPHMSERARDQARLDEVWRNREFKAFSRAKAPITNENKPDFGFSGSRQIAFSKASRLPQNGFTNDHYYQNHDNIPAFSRGDTVGTSSSNDAGSEHMQHVQILPNNLNVERNFKFSSNFGFPPHRMALTEQNLQQQNRSGRGVNKKAGIESPVSSIPFDQWADNVKLPNGSVRGANGRAGEENHSPKPTEPGAASAPKQPSDVDWVEAAADVPIPSVESSFVAVDKEHIPDLTAKPYSPDKSRRWDNDFTGQSFVVSESPPVRQRTSHVEQSRDKEIEGLAKKAVTTSRLTEIRERQSKENLRAGSKSPSPYVSSRSNETKARSLSNKDDEAALVGVPVADTPVVIYRLSSNSEDGKASQLKPLERSNSELSDSHDHLQRLARAMSSTPRSSPASENNIQHSTNPITFKIENNHVSTNTADAAEHIPIQAPILTDLKSIAQTPKVTGAWTDTILPDTVKPKKQQFSSQGYTQTPHVSAGGWIETPAPIEQRRYQGTVPTIVEEVPEELTSGIVKNSTNENDVNGLPANDDSQTSAQTEIADQPKSALATILDRQRVRLSSQDVKNGPQEDTLNLGNDTLESLQDLLDLDENDITTLSRLSHVEDDIRTLGEVEAEAVLLQRISAKLDRVRNNIHDARKGISKLEHQVSQPPEQRMVSITSQQLFSETTCKTCNQQTCQPHSHTEPTTHSSKHFPHASLNVSIPIPLLFHTRKPDQILPRPTTFAYLMLALWLWYVTESIMCELYCRPEYTDFYVWPTQPEPEFPFVLPTMVGRWTQLERFAVGSVLTEAWRFSTRMAVAFGRIGGMLGGWSDGFTDSDKVGIGRKVAEKMVQTVTQAVTSAATGSTNVDLSMDNDEYM